MSDINGSKAVKGNDKRHGKAGNRRSGNRRIPRSSKELLGYDSMLSNGIAYLGGDRWSVSLRISDINYQVATQDQQLDVVDRWGRFLNSVGENMGVQITVATRMLDPEEVTRSIAMPLRGDMLDGLRGDFNRNVRRRLAGRSQGAVTDKYLTLTLRERDGERAVTLLNRAVLRAIHYFEENARTLAQRDALLAGDFAAFARLVEKSGHSSFECCQNVYCASSPKHQGLSAALAISQSILAGTGGAWRMQGGGFAGTIQAFVPDALVKRYCAAMEALFGPGCCYLLSLREQGTVRVM